MCKIVNVKRKSDLVRINPRIPRALSLLLKEELARTGLKMEFFVQRAISAELGRMYRERGRKLAGRFISKQEAEAALDAALKAVSATRRIIESGDARL